MEKFTVAIQAGGKSSRMGEDKALIEFQNTTLIEYILKQVKGLGNETIIISNTPEKFYKYGRKVFRDILPNIGALGGIFTAIKQSSHSKCLLLACDMPFINLALIKHIISISDDYDLVIPRLKNKNFSEPFRAVYSKNCLDAIEEAIDRGQKRVVSFFDHVNTHYLEYPEIIKFDPDLISFFNINTPQDLMIANGIAKKVS